jgi:hypothetical protein
MGRIRSWDDFEPEERDHFNDRHKKGGQESDNFRDTYDIQLPEEAMKELKAVRFAEVLTTLIEKEIFN